ncbi:MAG TPA: hypothetical protein VIL86_15260 [Tepidisphaeraceae bacterium]|jgi:hypothetical protein
MPSLSRTNAALQEGIDAGLHLGGQLYVSLRGELAAAVVLNGMPGEAKHQQRMRMILAALYDDLGLATSLLHP